MNKLFNKIAVAFVGIAMAIGVGVALGNGDKDAVEVKAAEQTYYTLACTTQSGNSAYANYYDVSITSGTLTHTWNAPGNQTLGDYWRIGGKGGSQASSVSTFDRVIKGTSSFAEAISSITIYHNGTSNAGAVINSVTLTVASNSGFSSDVVEVELTPTIAKTTAGNFTFRPTAPATDWPTSRYYKFTFNITCTGKSNYGLDVASIAFKHDVVSSDYATNLSASPSTISPAKGSLVADALSGLTITAQKNGQSAAAYSNYSATITRRDDVVDEVSDATVFRAGDKKITLTANDPTTQGGSTYATFEITTNVSFTTVVNVGSKYALVSDTNVFTCAISSNRGQYASYSKTPSSYALLVENGVHPGTYALKVMSGTNANKYVAYTGSTSQLGLSDAKNLLSSWVIFNDGENDIIACASLESATLRFNSDRFCVYAGATGDAPNFLLLGTPNCDTFATIFMKMTSYDEGGTKGEQGEGDGVSCKSYYPIAKAVFNGTATGDNAQYNLSSDERDAICDEDGLYADVYERLQEWARINGDTISGSNLLTKASANVMSFDADLADNSATLIIIVVSSLSLVVLGGFLMMKKRKENR